MVTAETAVVLPVFVLLLGFSLWALGVLSAQLRCVDAARAGARAAARGESVAEVRSRTREAAGSGAVVSVEQSGPVVVVEVRRRVVPPWPLLARLLPAVTVHADAAADVEPGEVPS